MTSCSIVVQLAGPDYMLGFRAYKKEWGQQKLVIVTHSTRTKYLTQIK